MKRVPWILRFASMVGAIVMLAGCTYEAAVRQLPPPEQAAFRAYSKVMTSGQVRTYLAKGTAAERAAYLNEIGIARRFQALDPQDREAVLAGYPRQGMSADALRFLWGEPYYTSGYTGRHEHWFYLGSAFALAQYGNHHSGGTMVDVYLVDGQVAWWLEFLPTMVPNDPNDGDWGR